MTPRPDIPALLPADINPAATTAICCAGSHGMCPGKVHAWPPIDGEGLIDCQCPCHTGTGTSSP